MRPPVMPPAASRLAAGVVNFDGDDEPADGVVVGDRGLEARAAEGALDLRALLPASGGPGAPPAAAPVVGSDWLRRSYWSITASRSIVPV